MSLFNVSKLMKVRLAPTTSATPAAQEAIRRGIGKLAKPMPQRLHPENMLVAAAASHMRRCFVHRTLLPSAFMVRFVVARRSDGQVRQCGREDRWACWACVGTDCCPVLPPSLCAFAHVQAAIVVDPTARRRAGRGRWLSACYATVQFAATTKARRSKPLHRMTPAPGGLFYRESNWTSPVEIRPDLADVALVRHHEHFHSLVAKAILRKRCIVGRDAVERHVVEAQRRRHAAAPHDDRGVVVTVDMSRLAVLLPTVSGGAVDFDAVHDLASKVDFTQRSAQIGPVAVAPGVLDWPTCVALLPAAARAELGLDPDAPPDVVALNGDLFSRHVYFTALRLAGLQAPAAEN